MKPFTLRNRLFYAFLLFSALAAATGGLGLVFANRIATLTQTGAALDALLAECTRMVRAEQAFFIFDRTDPEFYQSGTSPSLQLHLASKQRLKKQISEIHFSGSVSLSPEHSQMLSKLPTFLKEYDNRFDDLRLLLFKRGFKDWGMEGTMRENAHKLETESKGIALVDLLTLRRHEKDFIIRHDTLYAQKFNALADALLWRLKRENADAATHAFLTDYQASFNEVVTLDNAIGISPKAGTWADVNTLSTQLVSTMEMITAGVTAKVNEEKSRLMRLGIMGILGIALLGAIVSRLISRSITAPLEKLGQAMQTTVNSQFAHLKEAPITPAKDEVALILTRYNLLLTELRKKITAIETQSRAQQAQNEILNQLNDELALSQKVLEEANAAKNKLFAIISHDFRAPLRSLSSYLHLLEQDFDSMKPEQVKTFACELRKKIVGVLSSMDNLLQWSLFQSQSLPFQIREIQVSPLAKSIFQLYEGVALEKGLQVQIQVPEEATVTADQTMLEFVLRNLLSNAIKFSFPGGTIRLHAVKSGDHWLIGVFDQGIGLTEEQKSAILSSGQHESTYGTQSEKGTGLGLALCREFILKHGSELEITSEKGIGTLIGFRLPRVIHA